MTPSPPRFTEWLLHLLLDEQARETVLVDLHESYVMAWKRRGAVRARLSYYRGAFHSIVTCRITGKRRADARRHDYDAGAIVSLRDLLRQALMLAVLGTTVGLIAAILGTKSLQGLQHGVAPLDVRTFAFAGIAVLGLATLAAWQPAARAERVDPAETLRAE